MRQARPHFSGHAKNEEVAIQRAHGLDVRLGGTCEHVLELLFARDVHRLYPILRRKSRRSRASCSVSTPLGEAPSITPRTPRPDSFSASTTSTGFAVAQKIEHTSGTSLMRPSTLMGYPSRMAMTKMWPAAMAWALRMASALSASSLPSARVRHGPDASLKATPNFIWGTELTRASYKSSTDLM